MDSPAAAPSPTRPRVMIHTGATASSSAATAGAPALPLAPAPAPALASASTSASSPTAATSAASSGSNGGGNWTLPTLPTRTYGPRPPTSLPAPTAATTSAARQAGAVTRGGQDDENGDGYAPAAAPASNARRSRPPLASGESKESIETRSTPSPPPPATAAVAAVPASDAAPSAETATGGSGGGGGGNDDDEAEESSDDESDDAPSGPTAAEVYARPLLYYKRAPVRRARAGAANPPIVVDQGPTQLLLPDSSMCLGFRPTAREGSRGGNRGGVGGARGDAGVNAAGAGDELDHVVVFTPPNEEQASKTKLFACLLLFLIPADLILICTIYFLGGPVVDTMTYAAGTTDLVTFLSALVALCLGVLGMKLRDTRILTLFIVVFYIDAIINLVRVSSILQLAQFFMQISVCHVTSLYKVSLVPQWWVADS